MSDAKVRNPFVYSAAARRYARGRPNFHAQVVRRVQRVLRVNKAEVDLVVDVGCGTGASSIAFASVARRVLAIDPSIAMLACARKNARVTYARAQAERIPAKKASADLVVAGVAFHWFDQSRFLKEAMRVLKPGGWLVVYSDYCTFKTSGSKLLRQWAEDQYYKTFPAPPHHHYRVEPSLARRFCFSNASVQRFTYSIDFRLNEFVEYLTTHSNVIVAVGSNDPRLRAVRHFLSSDLRSLFGKRKRRVKFECTLQVFRRRAQNARCQADFCKRDCRR